MPCTVTAADLAVIAPWESDASIEARRKAQDAFDSAKDKLAEHLRDIGDLDYSGMTPAELGRVANRLCAMHATFTAIMVAALDELADCTPAIIRTLDSDYYGRGMADLAGDYVPDGYTVIESIRIAQEEM